MLGRVCKILTFDTLKILYYSLIYPYLFYCCIIWGTASATSLHKLEVLQNRAVRLITRSPYRSSSSPIFKRLNILKLVDICRLQIALFMFRTRESTLPSCCLLLCPLNENNCYGIRNMHEFVMPAFRTKCREKSISVSGPRLWSLLPNDLRSSISLFVLRKNVKSYFVSLY